MKKYLGTILTLIAVAGIALAGLGPMIHAQQVYPPVTATALSPAGVSGNCAQWGSNGTMGDAGAPCGSGGGSSAFSAITSGTNTTAAMVVGSGASLGATGSGSLTATAVPFSGVSTGTNTTGTLTVGTGGSITTSGSGTITATAVPFSGVTGTVTATVASPAGTSGNCMKWGAAGAFGDAGNPCFTPISSANGAMAFTTSTNGGTAAQAFPNGTVSILPYNMPYITASKITVQIDAQDVSHNYDIGFYSLPTSGTTATLVADIGAQSISGTGVKDFTFAQGSVTFKPGLYLFAYTGAATTATFSLVTAFALTNVSTSATSSGGALPGTMTIAVGASAATPTNGQPWMALR